MTSGHPASPATDGQDTAGAGTAPATDPPSNAPSPEADPARERRVPGAEEDRAGLAAQPRPGPRVGRGARRWLVAFAAVALLAEMALAMLTAARQQTPTVDEPVYVGAAVVYLQQDSLRYNPEHPPLGKLIMAAGLAFASPRLDPGFIGIQQELGRHLLYESGNDPWRLMFLARLPMILLTLLFGLVVFAFARDLTGTAGGLLALALYALSPDVIAHGSLATLDVSAIGFLLSALWLAWRARRRPLLYLPLTGLALGAAIATRMSALPAIPVLMFLVILSVWHASRGGVSTGTAPRRAASRVGASSDGASSDGALRRAASRGEASIDGASDGGVLRDGGRSGRASRGAASRGRALALGVVAAVGVAAVSVAVVWATYLAVDPRLHWTPPSDMPVVDGLRGLFIDALPLPRPYRDGMRVQVGFEDTTWGGFLFGRQYSGPLWYYLPVALLVKSPLGALALWLGGAVAMLSVRRLRAAVAYLLVPTAVLMAVAMTETRNLGVRYAIFVPVFGAVVAAAVVAVRWRWTRVAAVALALFVAVSSVRTFPYYLPYSNEAFGGPSKTYLRLHDSNVDWGQDLGRLADHLRQRYPGERVWLVYKGSGVPAYYGIAASDPLRVPERQVTGLLVVSDAWIDKANGRLRHLIDTSTPIDTVGHSITIFRR